MTVTSEMPAMEPAIDRPPARPVVGISSKPSAGIERSLEERFAAGEPGAFEEVVANHHAMVRRLAFRLLGWTGEAEDVVQEVFVAALSQAKRFRADASLSTWLTTITLNKCRSHRRQMWSKWKSAIGWWRARADAAESSAAPVERDDVSEHVREAVRELPPKDREVIVLHYLERMTVEDLAGLLRVSRNVIDVRLHRARQRLKEQLKGLIEYE
jgi:RNA polymerase sigma-70 factor (ECF subfamily)